MGRNQNKKQLALTGAAGHLFERLPRPIPLAVIFFTITMFKPASESYRVLGRILSPSGVKDHVTFLRTQSAC